MKVSTLLCFAVLWAFLGSSLGFAQASNAPAFTGTALTYDGKAPAERLAVLDAKGKPEFITLGTARRGQPFPLSRGGNPVVFLRERTNPQPGESPFEPAGSIAWPSDAKERVVFIVAVGADASGRIAVRGIAANDDVGHFPVNSARFVNLTGSELALRFGGRDSQIAAGFSSPQVYPVTAEPESLEIPIIQTVLAQRVGDQFKLIYRGRINAWSNSRSLVIVSPAGEGSANPRVRVVLENISPPKPAGAS
jgi:hypothetical protein